MFCRAGDGSERYRRNPVPDMGSAPSQFIPFCSFKMTGKQKGKKSPDRQIHLLLQRLHWAEF